MSIPDVEWWRRRAATWKRLAKQSLRWSTWHDRPILFGRLSQMASQEEVKGFGDALSRLSDRVMVLPDGYAVEYIAPISPPVRRLLAHLYAWADAEKKRQAEHPAINHATVLLDVWNDLPEMLKMIGEQQFKEMRR